MKVLIATAMYPTPENPAFGSFVRTQAESLREIGVDVELLVLGGRPRKLAYPRGAIELRRRLAADPAIALVHAHYSYVGVVARTQRRVPVVVTYHGSDLNGTFGPDGRLTALSRLDIAISTALARAVDAVIVQSRRMAAKLRGANVHVVPHEVDLATFSPVGRAEARARLGLDPRRPYLLFAAKPENAVKNYPLARAAAEALAARGLPAELLAIFKEPQERLALYMSACDALVFPSFSEGSPNVVKQAMACNLPIVATDVGDVAEVIGGTQGCYVCEPRAEEFAARLQEIIAGGRRTRGREQIRHLDKPLVARAVLGVYQQAVDRRRERPREARQGL